MTVIENTPELSFSDLVNIGFEPFTDMDYEAFAGVESENPMIAELQDSSYQGILILDGDVLILIDDGGEETQWFLSMEKKFG